MQTSNRQGYSPTPEPSARPFQNPLCQRAGGFSLLAVRSCFRFPFGPAASASLLAAPSVRAGYMEILRRAQPLFFAPLRFFAHLVNLLNFNDLR